MFKLFFQEGEGDDPQENLISEAANRLDVGEFQLFQLGYEAWYGHSPEPDRIEPHFYSYMVNDDPPPWARHFARRIIALDTEGALDSTASEFHRFDNVLATPPRWIGWAVILATLAVVAVFMALIVSGDPGLDPHCIFPPCP